MVHRALKVARAVFGTAAVLVAVGGVPSTSSLPGFARVANAPLPDQVTERDAAVDLVVLDDRDMSPLPGARARVFLLLDEKAYLAAEVLTDGAGQSKLAGLPRGEAWIVVEAPGHARGSTRVILEGGTVRAVRIDLGAEHVIAVSVRDDKGVPLSGAQIEVLSRTDPLPVGARSGADGTAQVGRLAAGPWTLSVRAAGFEDGSVRATHDGETVPVVLRKLGAIVVHVTGSDERGVAGAEVDVAGAMLWPSRIATSDAEGNVRIGALEAGTYALRAKKGGIVSPIDVGVALDRGEEKALTLKLAPGQFVTVHVREDDVTPISGARLTLAEGGLSPFPIEALADGKGIAHLGPYSPGPATLSARADGFVSRGAIAVDDPPPREMGVVLVRAGLLTGRVVDAKGYPIDGASIQLVGTDPSGGPVFDDPRRTVFQAAHFDAMLGGPAPLVPAGELGVVPGPVPAIPWGAAASIPSFAAASMHASAPAEPWVTGSDGTFRAGPASPGRVRAIVRHPQYVETQSDVVTLRSGGEAHVDIVMQSGGALEGRVLDSRDMPVSGARVVVSAMRGAMERATLSASDGTFAFAALPDSVMVRASAGDDDGDDQAGVQLDVRVPEGGRKELTIHLPEPRSPLPVSVVDAEGWPVAAAQVTVSSLATGAPLRITAFTDAHGDASIKGAQGLPLHVEVRAPGHAPRVTSTDATIDALRVELTPAASATGQVVAERGDPVAGAEVVLYTDVGVRRARTGADGAFALSDLAPGVARLRARADGFAPYEREVTVPDDERRAFDLGRVELAVEGVVEGDVVDADGNPVAGARVAKDHVPTWLIVGANPRESAVTDANGAFALRGLPEGNVTLEAYAPDSGRAQASGVKVVAGRTTERVRITLSRAPLSPDERASDVSGLTGSVAVTLGETSAPAEVVIVSVTEASEAERAGLAPGDVLLSVDGALTQTIAVARAKLSGPVTADVIVSVRRGAETRTLRVGRENVRR